MTTQITKGPVGAQDLENYDGVNATFTRITSTGYTETLNSVGSEVDALMAYGGGVNYNSTTINSALTAIGVNQATVMLRPGSWMMNSNITVPVNVTLKVPNGAVITTTGYTITVNGPIEAGAYTIFSGTGTAAGLITAVPQWFGASPAASATTNVTAFNNAINSLAVTTYEPASLAYDAATGTVNVPAGEYQFNNPLTISYYTKIVASGGAIFLGTDVTKDIIYSQHPYHNTIRGITFAGGKSHINVMNGSNILGTDGLEGVKTDLIDCQFYRSTDISVKLARNATNGGWTVNMIRPHMFHNAQDLSATDVDSVFVDHPWMEPDKSFVADNVALVVVGASTAMTMDNIVAAPSSFVANTKNRWIDNYGKITLNNPRFGAESGGGLPAVYNFTDIFSAVSYPYLSETSITVRGGGAYCGAAGGADAGMIVLKSGLPNSISVEGVTGLYDTLSIINTTQMTGGVTLATYLTGITDADPSTAQNPILNISLKNNPMWKGSLVTAATDTTSDQARLRPWMDSIQDVVGAYGNNVQMNNITLLSLYGQSYPQTSSTTGVSVVNTGVALPQSYGSAAGVYLVSITGNPNLPGSSLNRDSVVGVVTITQTGANAAIAWTAIKAGGTLTVTPSIATGAIVLSIGGYASGAEGYDQVVKIVRLI